MKHHLKHIHTYIYDIFVLYNHVYTSGRRVKMVWSIISDEKFVTSSLTLWYKIVSTSRCSVSSPVHLFSATSQSIREFDVLLPIYIDNFFIPQWFYYVAMQVHRAKI